MADPPKPSQLDKFRDLARELETDEDPAHFEETVRKIAPRSPMTAECQHCGCTFPATEGHVGDDATLCGVCLHDD